MKLSKTIRLKLKLLLGILALLLFTSTNSYAQTKISGTVVNQQTNAPISGATVTVKKTKRFAIANETGRFSIEAALGEVLVITAVGFEKMEVKITSAETNVQLLQVVSQLDNIVVIGYGRVKRKDLTGGISSISGAELRKSQPTTVDQALQGKVAGVVVQQISGQPGGGVSIQIHGISSINGSNSPLYVIDGVVIQQPNDPGNGSNPLNTINPSEIESIDVLKDASATAIYGSQATNGVVVITTKRGRFNEKMQIRYTTQFGFTKLQPVNIEVMNSRQFLNLQKQYGEGYGSTLTDAEIDAISKQTNTFWSDIFFRTGITKSHDLAFTSGSANTNNFTGLGYFE